MNDNQEILVPAQQGRAVAVARGATIRIVDVAGQQVADTWAFMQDDPGEWLSTGHTLTITDRLFPEIGSRFFTNVSRPILTLTGDTSPGPHDMLYPPCDAEMYALGGATDHPNCRDNFRSAMRAVGLDPAYVPNPVNLFQNSLPRADGTIEVETSLSNAGNHVELRAEADLYLVVTACSVDGHPTNGFDCTEIRIEISSPGPPAGA